MSRIPDFSSLGQTPAPQAPLSVARVDVSPLEFTVRQGPGEAAIRGGAQIASAGIQMQEHIDTLRAEDAYNQLIQKRSELEHSPEIGFANVKGSAAIDRKFYEDYNRRFTDAATGIQDTLGTPNQKQLFKNRAAVANAQYQSALLTHMSQQTSAFADQTEKTSVQVEINNASNARSDAEFDTSMTRIRGVLDARGSRLNEPPAETELNKQKAISTAWTDRIKVLGTTDPLAAQKMYNENSEKIGFGEKVVLEHQLKQLVTPIQAKNLAMSVIAGAKVDDIVQAVTVGGDNALNGIVTAQDRIGDGLPRTKVDTKASLYQWIADADEAAQRVKPNDPVFRDLVVQQVKGYVGTLVSAQDGVSRAAHGLLTAAAMGDGKTKPMTLDDLLTTPELRGAWAVTQPEAQRGILAMLEHNTRGTPIKADAATVEMLFRRIHAAPGDPDRITSPVQITPYFARGVNEGYYKFLKDEIAQQQNEEGRNLTKTREDYLHGVKGQFDKSTMFDLDQQGGERFNKFRTFVLQQEAKAVKDGKIDPFSLYNYNSPNYISKSIPSFQASLETQLRNTTERLQQGARSLPVTPPLTLEKQRKEGESIDDYVKRVGIK